VTELTVEEDSPLHVKAVFEFLPAFSIDGYKDVKVDKPSVEITEEEFQHELAHLRDSRATIEPVEGTARSRTAIGPRSATRARSRATRPLNHPSTRPQPRPKAPPSRNPPMLSPSSLNRSAAKTRWSKLAARTRSKPSPTLSAASSPARS